MASTAIDSEAPSKRTAPTASVMEIFNGFLLIGATSFGNIVPYLRDGLVTKRGWIDDNGFIELMSISETLPGLNATNIAVLLGDRLQGVAGSIAALVGVCLPGAVVMYLAGIAYHIHGDRPFVTAMLKGVAAASTGLVLATIVQLGQKSLTGIADFVLVVVTVVAVNRLHLSVPYALLGVGSVAILWYRPRNETSTRRS